MPTAAISMTLTPDAQKLTLLAGNETYNPELEINGTVVNLFTQPIGVVLDPTVTPDGSQPPLPVGYVPDNPYDSSTFDLGMLGRLQNQGSDSILVSADRTVFEVEIAGAWVDLSDCFVNGDYSFPISGASQGRVRLEEIGGGDRLNTVGIDYGTKFRWQQCFAGICVDVFTGYVVEPPVYKQNDGGFYSLDLKLGDELLLKADTSRVQVQRYCGELPNTAGDAARIYAQTHNLITRTFPTGHVLLDRESQSFTNERPYDYLQALYAPTNQDVRCNQGGITVAPRDPFDAETAIAISESQVIEIEPAFRGGYEPVTKIRAKNQYLLVQGFVTRRFSKTVVSGTPDNTKPWFQGGYTETTTTQVFYGDSKIWEEAITFGYVPTTFPISKAVAQGDPCVSAVATEWARITRKLTNATFYTHISGSFLVEKIETWTFGKKLKEVPTDQYELYDDRIEYVIETYQNTPQINSEVCEKDYLHLQTRKRVSKWGLLDDFSYRLLSDEITTYTAAGQNPDALTAYVGAGQQWNQAIQSGAFDQKEQVFVTQPTQINENTNPPESQWIRPKVQRTNAFKEVSLNVGGSVELKPVNAPFCYNLDQLQVFGERYLQEIYGLANGLSLVAPYWLPVKLGQSVTYRGKNYRVFNLEINQTQNEATKTILLAEWVD